jgi:hypothetical protein
MPNGDFRQAARRFVVVSVIVLRMLIRMFVCRMNGRGECGEQGGSNNENAVAQESSNKRWQ